MLRDAQAYKKNKVDKDQQQEEIKLANMKNEGRQCISPTRPRSELPSKPPPAPSGPTKTPSQLTSPAPPRQFNIEEDKNPEEKAAERQKMEVMRKFYRNRHSSFLQALAENKNKKEKEEKAVKEAEERLRLQVK